MRLFIAEKPSMALEIAKCLGDWEKKDGFYQIGEERVTWLFGHILEMFNPEDYNAKYKAWCMTDLPIIPKAWRNKVSPSCEKQFKIVKDLISQAQEIVHAGDPDREGQLLIDEVLSFVGNQKPVQRILLNALDEKSIRAALADLRSNEDFEGLRASAELRQRTDWLTGMNYSRAVTLAARKKGHEGVFPIGRVKTPTLAIVVRREAEIQNFKPIKHYGIVGLFKTIRAKVEKEESFQMQWQPQGGSKGVDSENRLVDVVAMRDILERLNNGDRKGIVTKYEIQPQTERPKKPFSLSALQIAAGQAFGYEPQAVLDTCQALYEKKLTTYPRSDCEYLPMNQFAAATEILHHLKLTGSEELAAFANAADPELKSPAWDNSKITAHHALIPTVEICDFEKLKEEERNIYGLIARSYIAQFLPDHTYNQTKIEVQCSDELFTVSGKTVTSKLDWKIVYRKDQKDTAPEEDADEKTLPALNDGETIALMRATNNEKMTKPPKRFTPATLIQAMKDIHKFVLNDELKKTLKDVTGIGTEATRAGIIDDLIKKEFLIKEKKSVVPSAKANRLISILPNELTYPDFTALMEENLGKVSVGAAAPTAIGDMQIEEVRKMCALAMQLDMPAAAGSVPCPQCGQGVLLKRRGKNGDFWGCSCYPDCGASCPDADGRPDLTPRPQREKVTCPVCRTGELIFNKKFAFWGCSAYKDGCKGAFSDDGSGKPMLEPCTCGAYLRKFSGKKGEFWSCKTCNKTYNDQNGKPVIE